MGGRSRRTVLALGAGVLGTLAGCGGDGADGGSDIGTGTSVADTPVGTTVEDGEPTDGGDDAGETTGGNTLDGTGTDGNPDGTDTEGRGTTAAALDLREANVVGVEFESGDGRHRFSVTLYHDDDGEDGYADWWQVESLDGTRLGRRELLHAHSTAPFTRSETVEVPAGVTCVVVRGHDRTHGYGGRAMLVNLDSGATRAVDQGTENGSFSASDCP